MSKIYVTGHRNPDTDSIASAVGYAELRGRQDPDNTYEPVRLGECNAQSRWVLAQAGAEEPELLEHIMLRVCDVMQRDFYVASCDDPVRDVGLEMAQRRLDLVPIVDAEGTLAGVLTERALARRYIRESRAASTLVDTPTAVSAIASAVEGELITADDPVVSGRVWVFAMDAGWSESGISEGDVVVVGNREDAQRRAIDLRIGLLLVSNGERPSDAVIELARERGTSIVVSPLDSYVCGRMTTLAAPCRVLMDSKPLCVAEDDLLDDVADIIKDVYYRAAVVTDRKERPIGLVGRTDLVRPAPREVLLVDHAETAQSVVGLDQAQIVEILDHHHIGSIETRFPVRATFDPVGSTSTLVVERFQQAEEEPSRSTATLLLGGILSDTVIMNSPTTTPRDKAAIAYLGSLLGLDPEAFGREMFENGSDMTSVDAGDLVLHDAKSYETSAGTIVISQVEVVGNVLDERFEEMLAAMQAEQMRRGDVLRALMVTDIVAKDTNLLVVGDVASLERRISKTAIDGVIHLPGVMSRKKQVAPMLLEAF